MAGRHAKPRRSHVGPIASAAVVVSVLVGGVAGAVHFAPKWTGANAPTSVVTSGPASPSSPSTAASPTPSASPSPSRSAVKPSPTRPTDVVTPKSSRSPERASRNSTRSPAPSPTASRTTARAVTSGTCGASYYDQGQVTANGEQFDPEALTAAHKTLAFNTRVRVTNPDNGKSVIVRINDRGPYTAGRCLDLSRAAFRAIAPLGIGELTVKYEIPDQ